MIKLSIEITVNFDKTEEMNTQGVLLVNFSLIMASITVIILWFWTSPLILLGEKVNNIKVYERNELKGIRSQKNWTLGSFSLPPSTVFRIRSLNLQRKWQKATDEDLGECSCQATV